ncbi:MAG: UDP-2,3-diacylglucosamine diphosphatase LpxI [Magnetococcales bacterium]|nr:UDP-2,3-diacylglucosamine diphosphatase LpxI [Magnetococcales bacterium]
MSLTSAVMAVDKSSCKQSQPVKLSDTIGPLGLIAGNGRLPFILAEKLYQRGTPLAVAIGLKHETDPSLGRLTDFFHLVRLGQFKRIIKLLKRHKVKDLVMVGGVKKTRMWQTRPDIIAVRLLAKLKHLNDDLLLRAVIEILEERGFRVHSVTDFVPELLAPPGVLTHNLPNDDQWRDIAFGWKMAKALGDLDIGQGVVVRQRVVVAAEAMEGTDAMIQRAGPLARGQGILVKVIKPEQERRIDLPTIGPSTIKNLHKAGILMLAIEAGSTMILDLEKTLSTAEKLGVSLISCCQSDIDSGTPPRLFGNTIEGQSHG